MDEEKTLTLPSSGGAGGPGEGRSVVHVVHRVENRSKRSGRPPQAQQTRRARAGQVPPRPGKSRNIPKCPAPDVFIITLPRPARPFPPGAARIRLPGQAGPGDGTGLAPSRGAARCQPAAARFPSPLTPAAHPIRSPRGPTRREPPGSSLYCPAWPTLPRPCLRTRGHPTAPKAPAARPARLPTPPRSPPRTPATGPAASPKPSNCTARPWPAPPTTPPPCTASVRNITVPSVTATFIRVGSRVSRFNRTPTWAPHAGTWSATR